MKTMKVKTILKIDRMGKQVKTKCLLLRLFNKIVKLLNKEVTLFILPNILIKKIL